MKTCHTVMTGDVLPALAAHDTATKTARNHATRYSRGREHYLQLLTWAFTLFNSARLFCYLPTIWAIHISGDSSQHSLWTWGTFLGANATMAAWLYEKDDRRVSRAMLVNVSNAAMCAAHGDPDPGHPGVTQWPTDMSPFSSIEVQGRVAPR